MKVRATVYVTNLMKDSYKNSYMNSVLNHVKKVKLMFNKEFFIPSILFTENLFTSGEIAVFRGTRFRKRHSTF